MWKYTLDLSKAFVKISEEPQVWEIQNSARVIVEELEKFNVPPIPRSDTLDMIAARFRDIANDRMMANDEQFNFAMTMLYDLADKDKLIWVKTF